MLAIQMHVKFEKVLNNSAKTANQTTVREFVQECGHFSGFINNEMNLSENEIYVKCNSIKINYR